MRYRMIYDTLDHLMDYAPIVENLDLVIGELHKPWVTGTVSENGLRVTRREEEGKAFSHHFIASKHCVTVHVVLSGREVVATSYHELSKGKKEDEHGHIHIEDGSIASALTLGDGDVAIFMPSEPYCLGIQTDETTSMLKTLTVELDK
ncbi:MAG: DUF386 domain-containing protein [Spirochaetales bacterium]|nr:DUF386 domain-containing protein [Spirochaetales bacterium]